MTSQISSRVLLVGYAKCQLNVCDIMNNLYAPTCKTDCLDM